MMLKASIPALIGAAALALGTPAMAETYSCDDHAAHIDHSIGAQQALEAFHVLHGDKADDHHVVETLKKEHPEIEKELEEYVSHGCGEGELKAHMNDAETKQHDHH